MLPRLMAALTAGMLLCLGMASAVRAQQPIPPTHYSTDERGVDLTNGGYFPFVTEVVIGQPGAGGLAYGRSHIGTGWRDSLLGTVNTDGAPIATVTVSIGGYSDQFTDKGGGSYMPFNPASSATLSYASGVYTYTTSTGVVASFSTAWAGSTTPYTANLALVTSITSPDGEQLTYTYVTANMCANTGCTSTTPYARLQSVTNNAGYQIKYQYVQDGTAFATRANWLRVQRVTGLNNGVDYCAPSANTCTYTADWPRVEYATVNSTTATATDEMSRVTTYRNNTAGRITSIRWPGSTADNVTVAYDTAGQVDSITSADGTWTYDFSGVGGTVLATVAGPDGQGFQATSENGMIQYYTDADGEETYILWNAPGQPLRIDYPTGNSTEITYDARGNVTEMTQTAASGSGLADIVTSATYPTSCTASGITAVNCNLPLTTTDTRGNVTTYEWSSTHGGLLSVTQPEPTTGADQPQSRIAYSQVYAWYRNSAGNIVQAATPVWRPTSVSACQSGEAPGCLGTANERVTEIAYGATGVMNNLLPTGVTNRNGTSSITVTTTTGYTANGDPEYVDGPLSGTGDQTRFLYNANREVIGAIGPDPDGAGGLYNRAARITRNSLGLPTVAEQGRTNGYTDTDWAAFVSLQEAVTTYDDYGRPLRQSLSDGTTTFSLAQVSYDTSGRPDCTVVRMNPATFASPPTSACTAATAGSYGPDRISRTTYDDFGRVASVVSGYGTAGAITQSLTYGVNGQVATLTDGEGHLTTWTYDGFSRPWRMYYPNATGTGSSSTDYEQISYDAYGLMASTRTRDNQTFSYTYDALGRLTYVATPAGMLDQMWQYDLLGSQTAAVSVGTGGYGLYRTFDALGRMTAEEHLGVGVYYQWDAASNLTRITWPDGYYAQYVHDLTGAMTQVRENGATSGAGLLAVYGYDQLGRRTSVTRGNGAVTTYGWDGGSRLTSLSLNLSGTSQDATWTLGYNPAGQVVSRALSNSLYAYTGQPTLDDDYTNNGLNQVTAVDSTSVLYDGRGNITGDGQSEWNYDASNRITRGDYTGIDIGTYSYDPASRLSRITSSGVDSRFLYAGAQAVGEYDSSGALIRRYVPGAGLDDYAAYTTGTGGSISRDWPVVDPLGSVVGITNGSSVVTQINTYDEYGVPGTFSGRFGYAGSMYLNRAMAAPWFMRNRQYNPTLGRFMQTDPIGIQGGVNLYGYVRNDPVNAVDPWGLQNEYWVRHFVCNKGGNSYEDEVEEVVVHCWWVQVVVTLYFSPEFEGYGSDYLLQQMGYSGATVLGPYCPSRPVPPQYGQISSAAGVGATAHGAITGVTTATANSFRVPESARAASRAFAPLAIGLESTAAFFTFAGSRERGEPLDVATARAILPPAGGVGGGLGGGAIGALGGPVGAFLGATGGGASGAALGQRGASDYARARGCE